MPMASRSEPQPHHTGIAVIRIVPEQGPYGLGDQKPGERARPVNWHHQYPGRSNDWRSTWIPTESPVAPNSADSTAQVGPATWECVTLRNCSPSTAW